MTNALVPAEPTDLATVEPSGGGDILTCPAAFRHAMELAHTLARSSLLPTAFRGKPDDVFMAILLAQRMGEDPFTILQNVHFVNGKPGWSAPFLIARANKSGIFDGELSWETTGEGPSLAVTCSAVLKKSGQHVTKTVSLAMAKADGWTKNAKYASIGEQMLSYRSAVFLIRLYAPVVLFGLHTSDEWEDVAASKGERITYTDPEPAPQLGAPPARVSSPVVSEPVGAGSSSSSSAPNPRPSAGLAADSGADDPERTQRYDRIDALKQRHGGIVGEEVTRMGLRSRTSATLEQLDALIEAIESRAEREAIAEESGGEE